MVRKEIKQDSLKKAAALEGQKQFSMSHVEGNQHVLTISYALDFMKSIELMLVSEFPYILYEISLKNVLLFSVFLYDGYQSGS